MTEKKKETAEEKRQRLARAGSIGGKRSKGGGRPPIDTPDEKQLKTRTYNVSKLERKRRRDLALSHLPEGFVIKTEGALLPDDLIWFGADNKWLTAEWFVPNIKNAPVNVFSLVATKITNTIELPEPSENQTHWTISGLSSFPVKKKNK